MLEEDKAQYYSRWYYSGVRLLSSLPGFNEPERIASALNVKLQLVRDALAFLKRVNLCEEKNGKYYMSQERVFVSRDSPLAARHQANWRLKVVEKYDRSTSEEITFTAPVTLAKADAAIVREHILTLIDSLSTLVEKSPGEEFYCMNVDWFRVIETNQERR